MKIDLTGRVFFWLNVKRIIGKNDRKENLWECVCRCGNKIIVPTNSLTSGKTKSCGCYNSKRYKDIEIGTRFGSLVVLKKSDKKNHNYKVYECLCDCGNKCFVKSTNLLSGKTKSCGCRKKDSFVHAIHGFDILDHRLHSIYKSMIHRCYNKKSSSYRYYGAKGIGVCSEWLADEGSFFKFSYEHGYSSDKTIDRIDSRGFYCPENCQWISLRENILRMWFKKKKGYDPTIEELIK